MPVPSSTKVLTHAALGSRDVWALYSSCQDRQTYQHVLVLLCYNGTCEVTYSCDKETTMITSVMMM